jgi:hypothetical protein
LKLRFAEYRSESCTANNNYDALALLEVGGKAQSVITKLADLSKDTQLTSVTLKKSFDCGD